MTKNTITFCSDCGRALNPDSLVLTDAGVCICLRCSLIIQAKESADEVITENEIFRYGAEPSKNWD